MWEPDLPDEDDHLRQGDLLDLQPMPKRGKLSLTVDGLTSEVTPANRALVLERCCAVENKKTVMLAKVGEATDGGPEHAFTAALLRLDPEPGQPYAWYEHLLEPVVDILPPNPGKLWIVKLLERVSIAAKTHDELAELRARRVARMTVPARAQLRAKLAAHWSRAEFDDAEWLASNGYDWLGRPSRA